MHWKLLFLNMKRASCGDVEIKARRQFGKFEILVRKKCAKIIDCDCITKYNWIAGHLGGMSHDVVDHKKKLLLSICRDICNGLQFLHEHLVYPFDLAARCCQLSSDLRVKIGDYGLSRYITTKINLKRHYKLKFYCFKSCIFQVCT